MKMKKKLKTAGLTSERSSRVKKTPMNRFEALSDREDRRKFDF